MKLYHFLYQSLRFAVCPRVWQGDETPVFTGFRHSGPRDKTKKQFWSMIQLLSTVL